MLQSKKFTESLMGYYMLKLTVYFNLKFKPSFQKFFKYAFAKICELEI